MSARQTTVIIDCDPGHDDELNVDVALDIVRARSADLGIEAVARYR